MGTPCEQCGTPLIRPARGRPQNRFCSRACKEKARSAELTARVMAVRAGRVCGYCSGPIPIERNNRAKTCSPTCGVAYQNAKKADIRRVVWDKDRPSCERCGERIPDGRRAGSKFCSWRCKHRATSARRRLTAPHYMRQYLYGITPDQYQAMMAVQGNRCAICRSNEWRGKGNRPHIDHDHATDRVRGILCGNCNNGLGNFGDDPARLRAAAAYLERYQI